MSINVDGKDVSECAPVRVEGHNMKGKCTTSFTCPLCMRTFNEKGPWTNHRRACEGHTKEPPKGKRAICDICGEEQIATNLARHKRNIHGGEQWASPSPILGPAKVVTERRRRRRRRRRSVVWVRNLSYKQGSYCSFRSRSASAWSSWVNTYHDSKGYCAGKLWAKLTISFFI